MNLRFLTVRSCDVVGEPPEDGKGDLGGAGDTSSRSSRRGKRARLLADTAHRVPIVQATVPAVPKVLFNNLQTNEQRQKLRQSYKQLTGDAVGTRHRWRYSLQCPCACAHDMC